MEQGIDADLARFENEINKGYYALKMNLVKRFQN